MKRQIRTSAIALTAACTLLSTSCIGKFSLTRQVYAWNMNIGSKFVNELVFIPMTVVYAVTGTIDALIINSIEFWSGENPIAQGTRIIDGENDRFLVKTDATGYTITSLTDGTSTRLDFEPETRTWSIVDAEGTDRPLVTFVDDTHVAMPLADGSMTLVETSQAGLMAYRNAAGASAAMLANL